MSVPPPPSGGGGNKKGLVIGLIVGAVCLLGLVVALGLLAGGSDDGDESDEASTTATTTATVTTPTTLPASGSTEAAFGSVPGFTFRAAPSSVVGEIRTSFEDGFKAGLSEFPGLDVDTNQVIAGVEGRTVVRRGDEVGLAFALSLSPQWAAQVTPDDVLSGLKASPTGESTTVAGQDAVFYVEGGADGLATYKNGTFLIAVAEEGNRALLRELMTGLLANVA